MQIYGQVRVDYQYIDQGDGLRKLDGFATYDTYIGFRGEEKLGGGLSAWFQCESTLNITGEENFENGFCTRNSGVGFKGAWGNIFFGNWDLPYKIVSGSVYRPFSTSGSFGNAGLLHNGSASNVGNGLLAGTTPIGAGTGANENAGWSRRQANTVHFHSGNFAGFQVLGAYSATDESTQLTAWCRRRVPGRVCGRWARRGREVRFTSAARMSNTRTSVLAVRPSVPCPANTGKATTRRGRS